MNIFVLNFMLIFRWMGFLCCFYMHKCDKSMLPFFNMVSKRIIFAPYHYENFKT